MPSTHPRPLVGYPVRHHTGLYLHSPQEGQEAGQEAGQEEDQEAGPQEDPGEEHHQMTMDRGTSAGIAGSSVAGFSTPAAATVGRTAPTRQSASARL